MIDSNAYLQRDKLEKINKVDVTCKVGYQLSNDNLKNALIEIH